MELQTVINITLESLCMVICIVIFICLRLNGNLKNDLNRICLRLTITDFMLLASSITSWAFDGQTGAYARTAVLIANFMLYFLWCFLKSDASNYIFNYISVRTKISKKYIYAIWGICAASVLLIVISQFTDLYYSIDNNNRFQRNSLYWLAYIGPAILYVLGLTMVVLHRKNLEKRDTIVLLTFELLPGICLAVQIFHFGVMPVNTAATIALLLLYVRIQIEENKRLELELTESRISVMLSQIRPHFLYNSLVAIQELCRIDPETASNAVSEFSNYLRGNLDSLTTQNLISFEQELKHTETYLSLEKRRFGDKLNIVYEISARGFFIPALTLQPIVENAVRHGITKRETGGTVIVKTQETETQAVITVTDDGVGFVPRSKSGTDERSHIGTDNVRNRLKSMCGGTLDIWSTPNSGTTAVITIPKA